MTMIRKTITIPSAMEHWVKIQVATGRYASDSEYLRDLIRRDQERRAAETDLRTTLEAAEIGGLTDRPAETVGSDANAGANAGPAQATDSDE